MKREVITVKIERQKRRADFLFHNGAYRPQTVKSRKVYNRKKLAKPDIDTNWH